MSANDTKPDPDPQLTRLQKLAAMPDEMIDTDDIPEAPPENWARARRPLQEKRAVMPARKGQASLADRGPRKAGGDV